MDPLQSKDTDESFSSIVTSNPNLLGVLLFGSFALALICYIWAFCSQRHKLSSFREFLVLSLKRRHKELRGVQNTYYAAFSLLLFDGFTIISGLVWTIMAFCGNSEIVCLIFAVIWIAFRFCSICQHFITALISVLFVSRPKWGEGLRTLSEVLDVVPFVLIILSLRVSEHILIGVDIFNLLIMVAIVVSCCCLPATSPMAQQRRPIALLAAVMFFMVALPNGVFSCLMLASEDYHSVALDVQYFTSFYIILDAVLFYLVLKIEEDQSDTQYECAIRSV